LPSQKPSDAIVEDAGSAATTESLTRNQAFVLTDLCLDIVMPGLDPGIQDRPRRPRLSMDCRVKPGNDGLKMQHKQLKDRYSFPVGL
jgi:hypothetical protein